MGSGFRPHDRDRMTESVEWVWMGSWAVVKRGLGCKERGVSGYAVNRWGIKRPPNGTKIDRRSTYTKTTPHAKFHPILRTF